MKQFGLSVPCSCLRLDRGGITLGKVIMRLTLHCVHSVIFAIFLVVSVRGDCEFFKDGLKISDADELLKELPLNLGNCKKPAAIKEWLLSDQLAKRFSNIIPTLFVICACNSYADTYLNMRIEHGVEHEFLTEKTLADYNAGQQYGFTKLIRTCPCDISKENLLVYLCPLLPQIFNHFDVGFTISCLRAMFTNKYSFIESMMKKSETIKEQFYSQVFHESMYQLAFFKLFDKTDVNTFMSKFTPSLSQAVRKEKFSHSIYDRLVQSNGISPEDAYLCDRIKFYLIYSNELHDSSDKSEVYKEIAQFPEGNVLLKAFDKEIPTIHSTLDSIRSIFYNFVTNACKYRTDDTYLVLIGLYEFWNKSISEPTKPYQHEFTFSKVKQVLAEYISSKPGRPDLMVSDIFSKKNFIIKGTTNHFRLFRNFLYNLYYGTDFSIADEKQEIKKKEDWFPNCFLVKHEVIDLTLDWLDDKMTSKKYPFDEAFALEIFKFLVKMPSVTFYIVSNKRKFLKYLSPLIINKDLFEFHDKKTKYWNTDLYLFCQLFSDTQMQFTRNDILNYYFDSFDNVGVKMEKSEIKGEKVDDTKFKGKQPVNGFYPVYEYSNLNEDKLNLLIGLLKFINSIQSDEIFSIVFDSIFIRKERYEIDTEKLANQINENLPTVLESFGFGNNEAQIPTLADVTPTLKSIEDKVSFRNKILIFLQSNCTKQRKIIGGIDMDRLELLLIRIPNSDISNSTSGKELLTECNIFNDRLWKLYRTHALLNMKFLGVQGLIRRWSMDKIENERVQNVITNKKYSEIRKDEYGL